MISRDRSFWVWAEALDLLQGTQRLQRRIFTLQALRSVPCWEPSVDLYQNGDQLTLQVALPGVDFRQVDVALDAGGLTVRGERPMPSVCQAAAIHRLEIPYGRFERRIALPPGDFALLEKVHENGCLVLILRQLGQGREHGA